MRDADRVWVEGFLNSVLSSWREHADTPDGLFNPYLNREWQHDDDGTRTLVSQCRLIYNFARAYEHYGDPVYADLALRGIDALIESFQKTGQQGWVWACNGDGSLADDTYDAYGHAFVILALSTAAAALQDTDFRDLALQTWEFGQLRFRDKHGGLIWHISPDGQILDAVRSQNPMMHTFESLLVLAPQEPSGRVRQDAWQIWQFIQARLLGEGNLPEWYDPDWRPLASGPQAVSDVGHAFEWAWLLSEAQDLFPDEDLITSGRQFLAYGMRTGYDYEAGGIFSPVDHNGVLHDFRKGWWEQCEAIRTMQRYVTRHGADEIAAPLRQSLEFVAQFYVDHDYGGWYEGPVVDGQTLSLTKGTPWKLDYHVVNMCRELVAG